MICVECGHELESTTHTHFGTTELTRCDRCHEISDPYVEFELVIICLDIVLQRVQAFRHLLFNRWTQDKQRPALHPPFVVLSGICVLLDAYMRWSALCGPMDHTAPASMGLSTDSNATANATANASKTIDSTAPGFELFRGCSVQALPLVVHAFSDNILHCVVVCMVVRSAVPRSQLHLFRYRELIHAMMLGSSAKLAYLVALIWEYPTEYELLVELFVLSSTVLALSALRVCHSSIVPGLSLAVGCLARAGFSHASRLLWPNQLAPSKVLV